MKKVTELLAAVGGAIASFFVTMPPLVWILLAVMTIDYLTGIICGLKKKKKKTETGGLEAVMGATCLWFIASEGFSILENVASMGVPVPKILLKVLEIMRQKGDVPEEKPEEHPPVPYQQEEEKKEE